MKLFVLALFCVVSNAYDSSPVLSSRFLREENPSQACLPEDLTAACPDDSVVEADLEAQCDGNTGLNAAKCYMDYLCVNHDQETVNNHKRCIDVECPLAKHIPPLDCEAFLAEGPREEHNANEACLPEDLTDACPDGSVVEADLEAQCEGDTGLNAAKCYMDYLCVHHNQETVDNHKACIDVQCPLAKHIPPLNCASFLGDQPQDTAETADGGEEQEEAETTDAPAENVEAATATPTEATGGSTAEEETATTATEEEGGEGEDNAATIDPEEELIHEEVSFNVTKPPAQAAAESKGEGDSGGGGGGGKSVGGVVIGILFLVCVGALLFVYRGRLMGKKDHGVGSQPDLLPTSGRYLD